MFSKVFSTEDAYDTSQSFNNLDINLLVWVVYVQKFPTEAFFGAATKTLKDFPLSHFSCSAGNSILHKMVDA